MVKEKRTKHSVEFKRQIVEAVLSGKLKITEAARTNDIHPSLINKWLRKVREGKPLRVYAEPNGEQYSPDPQDREIFKLQAELQQYKQKVGEQALAIDFLKKAIEDSQRRKGSSGSIVTGLSWDPSKKRVK